MIIRPFARVGGLAVAYHTYIQEVICGNGVCVTERDSLDGLSGITDIPASVCSLSKTNLMSHINVYYTLFIIYYTKASIMICLRYVFHSVFYIRCWAHYRNKVLCVSKW